MQRPYSSMLAFAIALPIAACALPASEDGHEDILDEADPSSIEPEHALMDFESVGGEQLAALSSGDFVDWSGRVKIRLFYSSYGPGQHLSGASSVASDYVLVGGAAWVQNTEYGALLTESRPDFGLTTWYASSKDHLSYDSHTLHIIAIGMKLDGVTPSTLRSYMQVFSATSGSSSLPNTSITVPGNYLLIGGGSKVNYRGHGSLLTKSHPVGSTWYSESKDHYHFDYASVTSYAIGIQNTFIPGFGYLETTQSSATTFTSTSNGFATTGSPAGYVISCPGGSAQWNGNGRLLWGMMMDLGSAYNSTVATKDHYFADSGTSTAYAISVRLKP